MQFRKPVLFLILGSLCGYSAAKTTFTLEAAAFKQKDKAEAKAKELGGRGFPATVRYVPDSPGAFNYKVEVGQFESRSAAQGAKTALKRKKPGKQKRVRDDEGFFVRGQYEYKPARISDAIAGKLPQYFHVRKGKPVPAEMTTAPLEEPYLSAKTRALNGEATAPETLAAYRAVIETMPDNHPLKGREVISLAYRSFSGHSAYDRSRPDLTEIKDLLKKVATNQTSATMAQRVTARDLWVRIIHYYDNDYVSAIRAYRQIIEKNETTHPAMTAGYRCSLAAAIFEVSKVSGYSPSKSQEALSDLWKQNARVEANYLTSQSKQAQDIRYATARIGLMLSESYIEQKMWPQSQAVAESLIKAYDNYEDCWKAVAEAWCHVAGVHYEQQKYVDVLRASLEAENYANKTGKVWGDRTRDVMWKAYTWRIMAAYNLRDESVIKDTVAVMTSKFPDHPDLSSYVLPKYRSSGDAK